MPDASSSRLAALFPSGALVVTRDVPGDEGDLLPEEAACIVRAVDSRRREFAAGRWCAHRALEGLGAAPAPLLVGADRQPLWPAGIVGSITHTEGFCAAVVARVTHLRALGIDAERAGAVREALWRAILTPVELARIERQPASVRAMLAAVAFCAKEAFHKCQYPLTGEWLGFDEVEIDVEAEAGVGLETVPEIEGDAPKVQAGRFAIQPRRELELAKHSAAPWRGAFLEEAGLVIAGIGIAG